MSFIGLTAEAENILLRQNVKAQKIVSLNVIHVGVDVRVKEITFPDQNYLLQNLLVANIKVEGLVNVEGQGKLFTLLSTLSEKVEEITISFDMLPSQRQERKATNADYNALELFFRLLKEASRGRVKKIKVLDIHNVKSVHQIKEAFGIEVLSTSVLDTLECSGEEVDFVVLPDKGLAQKVLALPSFEKFQSKYKVLVGDKSRDPSTGLLKYNGLHSFQGASIQEDLGVYSIKVIDDICDGGMTFILLAEKLRELFPNASLELIVSHGIFSGDKLSELFKRYSRVSCTNLYNSVNTPKIEGTRAL